VATKAYVGNIPWALQEDELTKLFGEYGEVKSTKIITDRETGKSKGFAFVEMDNADNAIKSLDGTEVGGRKLRVNEARERSRSSYKPY